MFEMKSGQLRILPEKVSCDLYRFLDGDADAVNRYRGEYMSSYSWAEAMEGYAVYGYKFPIISVQVALVLIAVIDIIALFISSHQGLEVGSFILVIIINCLLIAAAITMKKSFKISQSLLYICFVIDFVQIIIKNIHAPNEPLIYYFMSLQFVIMEATLLLINYSYHQRELNRKSKK